MRFGTRLAAGLATTLLVLTAGFAGAQTPVAAPTPLPPGTFTWIPEQKPSNWPGTQGEWTALRQHCVDIFADIERGRHLPPGQYLKLSHSYGFRDTENCLNLAAGFRPPDVPQGPVPPAISPVPMPMPTPPPAPGAASPQS